MVNPTPAAPPPGERGSHAGARRRRRGLYGPPPRLTATSPLVGRLVWAIGDWGRASEHIGQRWEGVAARLLRQRLEPGDRLVVLAEDAPRLAEVLGSGLPHADALRAYVADGRLALEPLDFKWSLETASERQVAAETLVRLLAAELPQLSAVLDDVRTALSLPAGAEVEPLDGRFVAPEHPANRAALRADPRLPSLLLAVDAREFFRPLPAWATAEAVARVEGVELERLTSLEAMERYYRLGAGVAGALVRLGTGLFEEEPATVDTPAEVDAARREGRARTLNVLLLDLERRIAARRAREEQLAALPRMAYPFGRLRGDLARLGAPPSVLSSRGALGRIHGQVLAEVLRAIRSAGRDLVAQGIAEDEALAQLGQGSGRWAPIAARRTREIAAGLRALDQ